MNETRLKTWLAENRIEVNYDKDIKYVIAIVVFTTLVDSDYIKRDLSHSHAILDTKYFSRIFTDKLIDITLHDLNNSFHIVLEHFDSNDYSSAWTSVCCFFLFI